MNYRKLIFNILTCLIAPITYFINSLPGIYMAVVHKQYVYYDFEINSLHEYLNIVFGNLYFRMSLFTLILIFIPFQLIKDYYNKRNQRLTFLRKTILLSSIIAAWIVLWGLVGNIWFYPYYKNWVYLAFSISFGLFFTTFLHFTIDKYTERKD